MYKPDTSHQREPPAVPPHNFKHESARVRNSGRMYVVDGFADSMQRSWRADCQIGHGHVIVYRSDEPHDPEMPMARNLFIRDAIWRASTERSQISGVGGGEQGWG